MYISENFEGSGINPNRALALSLLLMGVSLLVYVVVMPGTRGTGFTLEDSLKGFFSALFLANAFFFVISVFVRQTAGLFIHYVEYLFGLAMFVAAGGATWEIIRLLVKFSYE